MTLNPCIIFESIGVASLVIPRLYIMTKIFRLNTSRKHTQANPVSLIAYQTRLLGLATPVRTKKWVWQMPNLDGASYA